MKHHLNVVRGSVRANGRVFSEGETVTLEDEATARALVATGAVAYRDQVAEAPDKGFDQASHDSELLGDIYDVVCKVEGVPGHPLLLDAVKWMAAELVNVRAELGAAMALANARPVAPPEPPAEAEPEPKDTPEAQAPDGPKDQPDPEPEPDPAKDAPKKRK